MRTIKQKKLSAWCFVLMASIGLALLLNAHVSQGQGNKPSLRDRIKIPKSSTTEETTPPITAQPAPKSTLNDKIDASASGVKIWKNQRLVLSAEGSTLTTPVISGRINQAQNSEGEIWLTVSYDDGAPFTMAKARDIHLDTLSSSHDGDAASLDISGSKPDEGLWHFVLPQIRPGNHFYRIRVESEIDAWHTNYSAQIIARANYTRMPFWNAQRIDGTIWQPPN